MCSASKGRANCPLVLTPHPCLRSLRSGVDQIKLGYISRALPKDNKNHVILGTYAVKPKDFAQQARRAHPLLSPGASCATLPARWPRRPQLAAHAAATAHARGLLLHCAALHAALLRWRRRL